MNKGTKKKLLRKTLEEVTVDLSYTNTDIFDYLADLLEAFESSIIQSPSTGYTNMRNLQTKIRHALDYFSKPENKGKIQERHLQYFQTTYQQTIERYSINTNENGEIIPKRRHLAHSSTPAQYSKTSVKNPYRRFK